VLKSFYSIILIAMGLLCGCGSFPILNTPLPSVVAGKTVSSQFSGWGLNWCSEGEPVKDLYSGPALNCISMGGEIYVVRVINGVSLVDGRAIADFDILVPAAVDGVGKHGIILVVEAAPTELATDTGVQNWAIDFAFQSFICPDDKSDFPSASCLEELKEKYAPVP
jgi:hypothetical protein